MRKFSRILLVLLLLVSLPSFVLAQETDNKNEELIERNTTKYFDLELVQAPQSPLGKTITYTLNIKPLMDSPETEILWNYPATLNVTPKHNRFIKMKEGETYSIKAVVKPKNAGTYNISVSVISWQHDTNYTNSIGDSLNFNENLVLQPVSFEFRLANILMVIGAVLIIGIGIFLVTKISKIGAEKARKWLTPPS